jgi:integrase
MAKREWISLEHKIFRMPNGKVYARPTIPALGRKEFPLGEKCKTLKQMIAAKERKVAEILRSKEEKPASLWRFEDLGLEIVNAKKAKADKTLDDAELHIEKHLIPWASEHAPYLWEWDEKGETLWQQYIDFKRKDLPKRKFFSHRKYLNMTLLAAFKRGIIKRKVTLYNPDPEIEVGKVFSHPEVKRLYEKASRTLKAQIMMAFTMGLRKSEILRLDWKRVDFKNQELIFLKENTKTRKPRIVPMNPYVLKTLTERNKRSESPWVFPSRYNPNVFQKSNRTAWKRAKERAKVIGRFHDLRHTFITNAVRAGMNPILICKYAGVSQEVMAKVYCHLDTTDLKKLAGGFGGNMGELLK